MSRLHASHVHVRAAFVAACLLMVGCGEVSERQSRERAALKTNDEPVTVDQ